MKACFVDRLAVEQNALVEAHQMRRDIALHALAVGTRSMASSMASVEPLPLVPATCTTGGQSAFGMIERLEQPHHSGPSDRSIALGVQRMQAL